MYLDQRARCDIEGGIPRVDSVWCDLDIEDTGEFGRRAFFHVDLGPTGCECTAAAAAVYKVK